MDVCRSRCCVVLRCRGGAARCGARGTKKLADVFARHAGRRLGRALTALMSGTNTTHAAHAHADAHAHTTGAAATGRHAACREPRAREPPGAAHDLTTSQSHDPL